jgi:hypothetical protein
VHAVVAFPVLITIMALYKRIIRDPFVHTEGRLCLVERRICILARSRLFNPASAPFQQIVRGPVSTLFLTLNSARFDTVSLLGRTSARISIIAHGETSTRSTFQFPLERFSRGSIQKACAFKKRSYRSYDSEVQNSECLQQPCCCRRQRN